MKHKLITGRYVKIEIFKASYPDRPQYELNYHTLSVTQRKRVQRWDDSELLTGKDVITIKFKVISQNLPQKQSKITNNLAQHSQCPDQDTNR